MYAVMMEGGKQYTISPGTVLKLEKLEAEVGDRVNFDNILLVNTDGDVRIGTPRVEGVPVVGEILRQYKAKKILVVKKKRRKGYRRVNGHRQLLTDVKILSIGDVSVTLNNIDNKPEEEEQKIPQSKEDSLSNQEDEGGITNGA